MFLFEAPFNDSGIDPGFVIVQLKALKDLSFRPTVLLTLRTGSPDPD